MRIMEAVTVAPGRIEVRSTESPPPPKAGEALLAIASVGLCGSDLEVFQARDPYAHFPMRQGHEYSAWVSELAAGYDGPLRTGDLVAVEPLLACGTCIACRRGHRNCCVDLRVTGSQIDGALIEQLVMPITNLHDATGLSTEEAAFVEPASIGLHMVTRSGLTLDDSAVVFGAGPIGQSVILAARSRGARVLAVDRVASRLALATLLGAEATVDASVQDVRAAISDWTLGEGAVAVFEATGSPAVFVTALHVAAHGGTVVLAGTPTAEVSIPPFLIVYKELNVLGSRNNAGVFSEAVGLVRANRHLIRELITHRFPLAAAQQAAEFAIGNPHQAGKVMVTVAGEMRT